MKTFAERAYEYLRKVPEGRVTTYKELAHALGTKAYQSVGQAMRNNPYAPEVPCHRVVSASGRVGGFRGERSGETIEKKIEMLTSEGIEIQDGKIVHFEKVLFRFS